MGHEGVYAYRGGAEGRQVPEGRALIEFQADPRRISGRGTMGSKAVALGGGSIDPADITGGYGSGGRLFDFASRSMGLAGLVNSMAGLADAASGGRLMNAVNQRAPSLGWLMQGGLLADAFQGLPELSEISPYNPKWQETTLA